MAGLTPSQRLSIIAELKSRGEDVSGYSVNPPAGAGGGAPGKTSQQDVAALKTLGQHVDQTQLLADRANEFMKLQGAGQSGVATGPVYSLPVVGDIARGITNLTDRDSAARMQQMDAINNQTWPMLRPPGSGAIRMFESTGWKKAFPYAGNYPDANEGLRDRYVDEANEARRHLQFVSDYIDSGKGSFGQAEASYALQPKQAAAAPPTQAAPRGRASAQAAPAPQQSDPFHQPGWSQNLPPKQLAAAKLYAGAKTPPGTKGNPYVPQNPGQFQKLAPGSWVIDDDGSLYQKRGQ